MSNIDNAVEHIIDAILSSEEYRQYDVQRNKVNQYPELKAQIDEYRKLNYELQNRKDYAFDKIDAFEREYAVFRENPLVSDFLAAELALCRMMQGINLRITEAMHFE